MKRFFTILLALTAVTAGLSAQQQTVSRVHDLKLNAGFDVSHKLSLRWKLGWAEEIYMKNDMRDEDRYYSRLTLTYSASDCLRIAPVIQLINLRNTAAKDDIAIFDLNFYYTRRLGRWSFTLREAPRLRYSFGGYDQRLRTNPEILLRTHLAVTYALTDRVSAFANAEIFNMLNAPQAIDNFYLQRFRANAGLRYAFDAHNAVSLYWRYDRTVAKQITLDADDSLSALNSKHSINNMLGIFYYYNF